VQRLAEPAINQLIGGVHLAAKVLGDEQHADDDSRQQISEYDLQKAEISIKRQAGNADDGQRAGFSGNNRQRNGPPGNVAVSQKIVAESTLRFTEAQPKDCDRRQIKRDDRQIERIQPVDSDLRFASSDLALPLCHPERGRAPARAFSVEGSWFAHLNPETRNSNRILSHL
jgi:hypothetical protein